MDVLSKMFNEGKTCILKMNPVNAYLGYFIEEAFKEAIEKNYLAVVYGKVEQAKLLLNMMRSMNYTSPVRIKPTTTSIGVRQVLNVQNVWHVIFQLHQSQALHP